MRPPSESESNRAKNFLARRLMISTMIVMTFMLSFGGIAVVNFLYDDRYVLAGPMVTLFGLAAVPQVAFSAYDGALLARGDSKRFFYLLLSTAIVQMVFLFFGVIHFGVFGAIFAPGIAALVAYPLRTYFLRHYKVNDNLGDTIFLVIGFFVNGLACWVYWDEILTLLP